MCMIAFAHQRSDESAMTVVSYYQLGNGAGVPYITYLSLQCFLIHQMLQEKCLSNKS